MKNTINYIYLLILSICLSSCGDAFETTLEIDPPAYIKRLAIHAFGSTSHNELRVLVSETVGILEDVPYSNFTEATVSLYQGDDLIYVLDKNGANNQQYNYLMPQGTHIFEKGMTYHIEVKAEGFPTATASANTPLDIIPSSILFDKNGGSNSDGNDLSEIKITFQDPVGTKDFYEINALDANEFTSDLYNRYTESFDPAITDGLTYLIMDDPSFDGSIKNLDLNIREIPQSQADKYLFLLWRVTSEAHFLFNKTARKQNEVEDNPFATPVQIYSNFENGIGIFSIVNESFIKVE